MKRKVFLISTALVLGIAVIASGTWCCLGWMVNRQMTQGSLWHSGTWPQMLGLSAEQRLKTEPLEKQLKADTDKLRVELSQNQMSLCRIMMTPGTLDRKVISQKLTEIGDLQKRQEERVVDHLVVLRQILTPQQQKTLFTTLMTDICRGCRNATGSKSDYCGLCKMQ